MSGRLLLRYACWQSPAGHVLPSVVCVGQNVMRVITLHRQQLSCLKVPTTNMRKKDTSARIPKT